MCLSTRAARPFTAMALALPLAALGGMASANDGFGGLTATGLSFGNTTDVAMVSEDLFIGLDRISVDYVFRNDAAQDVTGEMIFPLPPVSVWTALEGMINLPTPPYPDNLVGFSAVVDGKPVQVSIDRIAVIEPVQDDSTPQALQYDTPGRDVTAILGQYGLPLTLEADKVLEALEGLPPEAQAALAEQEIAWFEDDSEGGPRRGFPQWSLIYRYHWTQTFPAGAEVRVSHDYANYPAGGLFGWEHPVKEDYLADFARSYCIDEGTSKAIAKAVTGVDPATGEATGLGVAYFPSYVLRTANSWAGPIGKFRLTLDKGAAENVISLCVEGIKKTGPTTFTLERSNFSPERDLDILIVQPIKN